MVSKCCICGKETEELSSEYGISFVCYDCFGIYGNIDSHCWCFDDLCPKCKEKILNRIREGQSK
jgi:hypothetical protein